jgi:hypothetical protein
LREATSEISIYTLGGAKSFFTLPIKRKICYPFSFLNKIGFEINILSFSFKKKKISGISLGLIIWNHMTATHNCTLSKTKFSVIFFVKYKESVLLPNGFFFEKNALKLKLNVIVSCSPIALTKVRVIIVRRREPINLKEAPASEIAVRQQGPYD